MNIRSSGSKSELHEKTRNPKSEIRNKSKMVKSQNSKQARFGFPVLDFGFESYGLFRISSFGFRIFVR